MEEKIDPAQEALIRRFQDGDPEAFHTLFEEYVALLQARIARKLPTRLQRRVSVSDVLQEARIAAFERRQDFTDRGDGAFRKWLLGIAEMKARQAIRVHQGTARRAAGREVSRGDRMATEQYAGQQPTPSQFAVAAELGDLVKAAMEDLSPDYREVLRLVRVEHLTFQEAAERMGRSYEAVHKLHGRALLQFTEIFNQLVGDDDGQEGQGCRDPR
jgi:RNA polymerase sigma-70 factor (subfamily 1)